MPDNQKLIPSEPVSPAITSALDRVRHYVESAHADATKRAYASDWKRFAAWCERANLAALPADEVTLCSYVASAADAGAAPASLARYLVSISRIHKLANHKSPVTPRVRETMKGIRRTLGTKQKQMRPLLSEDIAAIVRHLDPTDTRDIRDRALLLIGFAAALRRSELVGLDVDDIERVPDGLAITVKRSKTDQEQAGRRIAVSYGDKPDTCPVLAVDAWMKRANLDAGPLFVGIVGSSKLKAERLDAEMVAHVVRRLVTLIGLDPDDYAGHSLRAGLVTSAARAGKPSHVIMRVTGHRSEAMLWRYIREAELFADPANKGIGL